MRDSNKCPLIRGTIDNPHKYIPRKLGYRKTQTTWMEWAPSSVPDTQDPTAEIPGFVKGAENANIFQPVLYASPSTRSNKISASPLQARRKYLTMVGGEIESPMGVVLFTKVCSVHFEMICPKNSGTPLVSWVWT